MKKRIIAIALVVMALIMTACGNGASGNEAPEEGEENEAQEGTDQEAQEDASSADAQESQGPQITFTSKDMEGKDVTSEELFGANDYTMVNCWASWCGPCIMELPEIEKISQEFADKNIGIIGVLMDAQEGTGLEDGKEIMEESGVTYTNIEKWEGFDDMILLQAYPTTFFVDSQGNVVGEAIIGADPDGYRETLNSLAG